MTVARRKPTDGSHDPSFKQEARREGIRRAFGKPTQEAFICLRGGRHGENSDLPRRFHRNEKSPPASCLLRKPHDAPGRQIPFSLELFVRSQVLWRGREELELDSFQRLEALVDRAGADDVEEANVLLRRFKGRSDKVTAAIDEFMLDFKTLVFVVETGEEGFEKQLRKLARTRLSKLKHLMNVPA
ncbi:hypothetical protein NKJ06_15450 [Mesorhizobium sp. M0293]|uniref:hypothetical protein n=1 Tax=unclassified Mesorhizobium TaxID=325217 RepID=UPI00333CDCE3